VCFCPVDFSFCVLSVAVSIFFGFLFVCVCAPAAD
jgi:hypothetical protein